jgi:hypothetical protein
MQRDPNAPLQVANQSYGDSQEDELVRLTNAVHFSDQLAASQPQPAAWQPQPAAQSAGPSTSDQQLQEQMTNFLGPARYQMFMEQGSHGLMTYERDQQRALAASHLAANHPVAAANAEPVVVPAQVQPRQQRDQPPLRRQRNFSGRGENAERRQGSSRDSSPRRRQGRSR